MSLFYLCSEINCDRKYKTKNGLVSHLEKIHKIITTDDFIPTMITKGNSIELNEKRCLAFREIGIQEKLIDNHEVKDLHEQKIMNTFYFCTEINCNRKYKTESKLVGHLLQIHKIIRNEINEPVEITKENKKNVENKKNDIKRIEQRELFIKEAETKQQLDLIAKQEAEDLYKKQQMEKWELIELQKLRLQDEQLELEKINFEKLKLLEDEKLRQQEKLINDEINFNKRVQEQYNNINPVFDEKMGPLVNSIKEEYSKNPNIFNDLIDSLTKPKDEPKNDFVEQTEKKQLCSICLDDDANAAIVPCGHSNFCHECISSHHINSQNKVCPICRTEIIMVVKLYS